MVSHRHDADLFGYVIDGTVAIGFDHKEANIFKAGQMFHEKRNVIHSLLRNPDKNTAAKVLLILGACERKGNTAPAGVPTLAGKLLLKRRLFKGLSAIVLNVSGFLLTSVILCHSCISSCHNSYEIV